MNQTETNFLIPPEFYFQPQYEAAFAPDAEKLIRDRQHPQGLTEFASICFSNSAATAGTPRVQLGWAKNGLIVQLRYGQPDWRAPVETVKRYLHGNLLQLFIDTRDIKTNRRLNRFCSHLLVEKSAEQDKELSIIKLTSQQQEPPLDSSQAAQYLSHTKTETTLSLFLHKEAVSGYDPENVPTIGFYYIWRDSNRVVHFGGLNDQFPVPIDPSLWPSLRLAER